MLHSQDALGSMRASSIGCPLQQPCFRRCQPGITSCTIFVKLRCAASFRKGALSRRSSRAGSRHRQPCQPCRATLTFSDGSSE